MFFYVWGAHFIGCRQPQCVPFLLADKNPVQFSSTCRVALKCNQNPNPKTEPSFQGQLWRGVCWLSCVHIPYTIAVPLSLRLMQDCLSLENKLDCHGATNLVLKADNNSQSSMGYVLTGHVPVKQSTPVYTLCCQNWHPYHPDQTVRHGSGSWRTRHSRLCITLSPDPASFKSHALSVTTSPPNHLISSLTMHSLISLQVLPLMAASYERLRRTGYCTEPKAFWRSWPADLPDFSFLRAPSSISSEQKGTSSNVFSFSRNLTRIWSTCSFAPDRTGNCSSLDPPRSLKSFSQVARMVSGSNSLTLQLH